MTIQSEEKPVIEDQPITVDFIKKNHPDLAAYLEEAGRASGRQEERERVAGIHRLATAGINPILIQQLVADGSTVESAAISMLLDINKTRTSLVSGFTAAEEKIKGLSSGPTTQSPEDELDADLRLAAAHGIKTR